MKGTIEREQLLEADLLAVWNFFSSPLNLAHLTPETMGLRILGPDLKEQIYEGMLLDYTIAPFFGIPLRWQTKIAHVEPYRSFTDSQEKGPFKKWKHEHQFVPTSKGVLMKDQVEFELPLGFLGKAAYWSMVENKLIALFEFRARVLETQFH